MEKVQLKRDAKKLAIVGVITFSGSCVWLSSKEYVVLWISMMRKRPYRFDRELFWKV